MKRKILTIVSLIFIMLISCFGLFACAHKHEFSKQDASEAYLAVEATCTEKAKYYYSCECGEKGSETFEYGELAAHEHTIIKNSETEHWYECVCGDKATAEAHKGGTATCTAKAVCEVCSASYGELLAHSYTELKHNETEHWYECACGAKDATTEAHKGGTATCTAKAVCEVCNTAYGELLPHEYDEQKFSATEHWNECYCGAKDGVEAHKGGTATCTVQATCEVCEQKYGALAPHVHDELKHNETEHWNECVCGDKANVSAHAYTIFKQEGGQKWYECACGHVDERMLIDVDAEVLMSLNSKKLFFNKTDLEGAEIIGAIYNGNSILTDGVLDVSAFAINQANPYVLHIETSVNRYSLNNVIAYTEVFEDTAESRELMVKIFSGRLEENGILNGSYALVENLNFNHFALDENGNKTYDADDNVLYSNKEAFDCNTGFQRPTGDVDEDGKPITEKVYTTFSGIFDGRGFALNNVLMRANATGQYYGLFGYYFADGATIKNVAINSVYKWMSKTNVNQEGGFHSVLFYAPVGWDTDASKEITLNLENVYIYRKQTSDQQSSAIISFKGANGEYTKLNVDNVVVINEFASELEDRRSSSFYGWQKTFAEGSNISDLFIVSNGTRGAYNKVGKANVSNYVYYQATKTTNSEDGTWSYDYNTIEDAINAMKAAGNDYSGFDSKYWTITMDANGTMPVWNSINAIPVLLDPDGNRIGEIITEKANEVYVVEAYDANGEAKQVTLTSDNDALIIDGNTIKIEGVAAFKAVVTATVGDVSVKFNVTVDTRPLVEENKAVILSKVDGKLYYENGEEVVLNSASYEGIELLKDNKLDLSLIVDSEGNPVDLGDEGKVIKLFASTDTAKCNFNNVKVYAGAFVNSRDSRLALAEVLSSRNRSHSSYYHYDIDVSKTVDGYYILLENIYFDHSNMPIGVENKALEEDFDLSGQTNEIFSNGTSTYFTTFKGTFDGRGFAINNIGSIEGSAMFATAGDGATIKNVAFNKFVAYKRNKVTEGENVYYYYSIQGQGTTAKIFHVVESANARVTFENVYINDPETLDNGAYGSLVFYNVLKDEADDTKRYHGNLTFKNVIIENAKGPVLSGSTGGWTAGLTDNDVVLNSYVITTASVARDTATLIANSRNENFVKYASIAAMAEANNDYTSFSSEYWTIENGVPVWASFPKAQLVDADSKEVASISAAGSYTANALIKGVATAKGITTACESEYVSCDGANVVVEAPEGVNLNTVITVYYNGEALLTVPVSIDNRIPVAIADEILLSKANGKLFLQNTSVKDVEIISATYNGVSVYADGVIDLSKIEVAIGTAFTLEIVAEDNLYSFTNVKMYDGVYENTTESRKAFVSLLAGADGETLTGYYVLAENLTFDHSVSKETFSSSKNIYDATFDGRGYTLNNINLASGSFFGMFGNVPGENAVLKNFAINGIYHNKTLATTYEGVFFSQGSVDNDTVNNTLTMSNIYIYRKLESTASNAQNCNILCYNRANQLTINMSNVIIEIEMTSDANKNANFASSKALGTATDTYFLINGRGATGSGYKAGPTGTVYYGAAEDANLAVARAAMVAANNDYTTFSSAYWTVAEGGVPTWKNVSVYYTEVSSESELVEALAKGGEIRLTNDITISNTLNVTVDTTIYGYGKTITYTGSDRAIDVKKDYAGVNLTLANLTINNSNATFSERVVNYNTNGKLVLYNVTLGGAKVNYAINLPSGSNDAQVVIKNSKISGVIALNVWGKNVNAIINETTLSSVYGSATTEGGAAIRINNNGETIAENCVITINNSKIIGTLADGTANVAILNDVAGTSITSNKTTVTGEIVNLNSAAIVEYSPNAYFYSFESLEEAVAMATGDATATVKLTANVTVETLEVLGNVTIDLNGYELTITTVNGEGLTVTGTGTYNGVAQ